MCGIDYLGAMPCVELGCKHIFHIECIQKRLSFRWLSPRITFSFLNCSKCKQLMRADHCQLINYELQKSLAFKRDVEQKALVRAQHEGIDKDARVRQPGGDYYNDLSGWSMFKLAYYQCFKCKNPYYGGMKDCI